MFFLLVSCFTELNKGDLVGNEDVCKHGLVCQAFRATSDHLKRTGTGSQQKSLPNHLITKLRDVVVFH